MMKLDQICTDMFCQGGCGKHHVLINHGFFQGFQPMMDVQHLPPIGYMVRRIGDAMEQSVLLVLDSIEVAMHAFSGCNCCCHQGCNHKQCDLDLPWCECPNMEFINAETGAPAD